MFLGRAGKIRCFDVRLSQSVFPEACVDLNANSRQTCSLRCVRYKLELGINGFRKNRGHSRFECLCFDETRT